MERLRPVVCAAAAIACLVPFGVGCTTMSKMSAGMTDVKNAVLPSKADSATQVVCLWQRRPQPLADPTHDGVMINGLVGQMFLVGPEGKAAEVAGDLAIVVYDESPRSDASKAMKPEMWHYTKDTLKKLTTTDDRFGKSHVLFLPWPKHWNDVTAVKIMAKYQSPGNPDLYAGEVKMTLDFSTAGGGSPWSDNNPKSGAMSMDTRGVPDPARMLRDFNFGGQKPMGDATVVPTGATARPIGSSTTTNTPNQPIILGR